jgi:micrococcal nuclease
MRPLDPVTAMCNPGASRSKDTAIVRWPLYIPAVLTRVAVVFALIFGVKPLACAAPQRVPSQQASCVVSHIVDGDTFYCQDGQKVRLIGIDSPERDQHPFGDQARRALLQLIPPGTSVGLQQDVASNDRYGRVLAYVWIDSTLINEAMVKNGWAVLYTVPPNIKYANRLERAQKEARALRSGLWSGSGFECLPGDFRRGRCLSRP